MAKVRAFYTTEAIATANGFDREEFNRSMNDFEKSTATSDEGYIAIIDNETGETVDCAHFVLVEGTDGQWYGNVLLSEMESVLSINDDISFDTIMDDIATMNFSPQEGCECQSIYQLNRSGEFYEVVNRTETEVTLRWLHGNYSRKVSIEGLKRNYSPVWKF